MLHQLRGRIVTETGLRIYKELTPIKKEQLDLENRTVWIPDSKTPNGVAEVPLTEIAVEAFRSQLAISGSSDYLFPSDENANGYQKTFKPFGTQRCDERVYDTFASTISDRLTPSGSALVESPTSGSSSCAGRATKPRPPSWQTEGVLTQLCHSWGKGQAKTMSRGSINSFGINEWFGRGGAI
jgi:hypothetical protein